MNFKKFGRTAQLFDYQTGTPTPYKYLDENGNENEVAEIAPWYITDYIPIPDGVLSVTLSKIGGGSPAMCAYDASKNYITGIKYNTGSAVTKVDITLTSSTPIRFIRFSYFLGNTGYDDISTKMLNEGSTALPYQPYKDWTGTPYYLHTTATDTITTLPADLYADGTNATVDLVGNMSQTGTPTPQNPITPSECGERTANLWNVTILSNSSISAENFWEKYDSSTVSTTMYMSCEANTTYYLYTPSSITSGIFRVYTSTSDTIPTLGNSIPVYEKTRSSSPISVFKFTTGANDKMLIIQVTTANSQTMADNAVLDNGYKIPILSASTTTPIYLGEVETTRKIKKIKASDITWIDGSATGYNFYRGTLTIPKLAGGGIPTLLSNKYRSVETRNNLSDGDIASYNITTVDTIVIRDDRYNSAADWLSANGDTEIWYVLAESETGIVNEPLRKIGDYADTVSGISIPTIAGKDAFDVLTTLKPSEVSLTYTGWHDASVGEWDGSEWQ